MICSKMTILLNDTLRNENRVELITNFVLRYETFETFVNTKDFRRYENESNEVEINENINFN